MQKLSAYQRLLLFATPALLCVVAFTQRYLAAEYHLCSWKGGGFGMFASLPADSSRFVTATLIAADGQEVPISPSSLMELTSGFLPRKIEAQPGESRDEPQEIVELVTMPTVGRAEALAQKLVAERWAAPAGRSIEARLLRNSRDKQLLLKAARVDVWKYHFNSPRSQFERTNLRTVTRAAESAP